MKNVGISILDSWLSYNYTTFHDPSSSDPNSKFGKSKKWQHNKSEKKKIIVSNQTYLLQELTFKSNIKTFDKATDRTISMQEVGCRVFVGAVKYFRKYLMCQKIFFIFFPNFNFSNFNWNVKWVWAQDIQTLHQGV